MPSKKFISRCDYKGVTSVGTRLQPVISTEGQDWVFEASQNGWWRIDDLELRFKRQQDGSDGADVTGTATFTVQLVNPPGGKKLVFAQDVDGKPYDGIAFCGAEPRPEMLTTSLTRGGKCLTIEMNCVELNQETLSYNFCWVVQEKGAAGEEYRSPDPVIDWPPTDPP